MEVPPERLIVVYDELDLPWTGVADPDRKDRRAAIMEWNP